MGGFLWPGLKVVHVTPCLLLERSYLQSLLTTAVVSNVGQLCACGREEQINERDFLLIYEILYSMCSDFSFSLRLWAHLGSSESLPSLPGGLCVRPLVLQPLLQGYLLIEASREDPRLPATFHLLMGLAGTPIFIPHETSIHLNYYFAVLYAYPCTKDFLISLFKVSVYFDICI